MKDLMRVKGFGHRIAPITPDEARTFGMDSFFPSAKLYNPNGQNYVPVDHQLMLTYTESPEGQIVHVVLTRQAQPLRSSHWAPPMTPTASR